MRFPSFASWLPRRVVQSDDQAELNNFCAALLIVEEESERYRLLLRMRAFFDERPKLIRKSKYNRLFYQDFLASLTREAVIMDPLRWRSLAELSRKLKA